MKRAAFILAALIFFSFLSSCEIQNNSSFVYYITDEPITLDPQTVSDKNGQFMVLNLFEGLMSLNDNGEIIPAVAESYSYSTGRYTFTLKENLLWSDGSSLTADDFVFALQRLLKPETKAPDASLFFCIKNAEAVFKGEKSASQLGVYSNGERTLIIELSYEDSNFLRYLTYPAAMPCNEEFFLSTKGKYGLEYDAILPNGAFKIVSWTHDVSAGLRRNDYYRDAKYVPSSLSVFIGNEERIFSEFADGNNIAVVSNVKQSSFTEAKHTSQTVLDSYSGIVFNTESEFFRNKDLRQALSLSFDRESYLSHLSDGAVIDEKFIYPDKSLYSYDAEAAKKAFNASGITKDSMNRIRIISLEGTGDKELLSYAVQVWQKDLGVFFGITELPKDEYLSALKSGEYDAAVVSFGFKQDNGASLLNSFTSASDKNYARLKSSTYDSLITNVSAATEFLTNEVLYIPAYMSYSYIYKQKNSQNISYNPEFSILYFGKAK